MAHESFEDPRVAAAMNADFVNIKVDREERPDLDQIYQTAHALMTRRSGGWPLTMFLTPGRRAVFRRHVFPEGRGATACRASSICCRASPRPIASRAPTIAEQAASSRTALASLEPAAPAARRAAAVRRPPRALAELEAAVRPRARRVRRGAQVSARDRSRALPARARCARGDADALDRGRRHARANGRRRHPRSARRRLLPLQRRRASGRFRTSRRCSTTTGRCLRLYADLARVTGDARFADVARGIVGWLTREMRAADGAFYSSLDADSEGEEGKFYVWDARRGARAARRPTLTRSPPALRPRRPAQFRRARVEPARDASRSPTSPRALGISAARRRRTGSTPRRRRCSRRASRRVRPGLDDKILTSWNALAIAGLARAARALDVPEWVGARRARPTDALRRTAWRDGRLLATRKGERAHLNAYLDDHAFLLAALIELMQARFRLADYAWARELADVLLAQFEDPRARRLLFHEPRSRAAVPSDEAGSRQRHAVGQRRRGRRAHRARPSLRGAALRRGGASGRCAFLRRRWRARPAGFSTMLAALRPISRSRRPRCCSPATPATCAAWQRALERDVPPGGARLQRRGHCVAGRARERRRPCGPGASRGSAAARSACPPIDDSLRLEQALASARSTVRLRRVAIRQSAFRYHSTAFSPPSLMEHR